MRKASLIVLLVGLMAGSLVDAQAGRNDSNHQQGKSTKGVSLDGQISKDGKTLLAEDDNVWTVSNAKMLEGLEGRHVTVKCRMDPDKRSIHVLYIVEPSKSYYSNYLRDSAFRR